MKLRLAFFSTLTCLALCLSISSAPARAGTTITVDTTNDELNSDGDCSLREAIRAANLDAAVSGCPAGSGADTIILPSGTYVLKIAGASEDAAVTGDLDIAGDLTITGAGASESIVEGGGDTTQDRAFQVISGSVSISGITIQNSELGFGQAGGGVFVNSAGALTLTNSTVNNNAAYSGGGITSGGNLTIINCTVSNNRSEDWGAILVGSGDHRLVLVDSVVFNNANDGGVTVASDYTSIISNTTVISNTGSGISNVGVVEIFASTIVSNTATGSGGGIYNHDVMTVTNSTISGNAADDDGGGIYVGDCESMILNNVTVVNNRADHDGDGSGDGGGINISDDRVPVRNSIIAGNTDTGGESPDCYSQSSAAPLNSYGYNLIQDTTGCIIIGDTTGNQTGVSPNLGPLQDNGGPTFTHALLPGSPAIDGGNPAGCVDGAGLPLSTDQRGFPRAVDGDGNGTDICDIGAYELLKPWVYLPLIW